MIEFTLNNRLEILVDEQIFKCTIQDKTDESLSITLPVKDGVYLTPVTGEKLEAIYYETLNVYKFETTVLGRKIEGSVRQLVLGEPQNVIKIQRRKFVRVEVTYITNFVQLINYGNIIDNGFKISQSPKYNCVILDISGGGFKMKSSQKLVIGSKVSTEISIDNEKLGILGEVVRAERKENGDYIYGLNFIEMDERIRERIIQFVFMIMRKQIKQN